MYSINVLVALGLTKYLHMKQSTVKLGNKELLALRNNFRATKKFLIAKFDCISNIEVIKKDKNLPVQLQLEK